MVTVANPGETSAIATWTEPTATDDVTAVVSRFRTASSGDRFPLGDTVVLYYFFDGAGNEATCEFTVSVVGK